MSGIRTRSRSALAAAIAVAALAALGSPAFAGNQTSGVKSYTGCLTPSEGVIIKIKEASWVQPKECV